MKNKKNFKGLNIPLLNGWFLMSDPNNIILARIDGDRKVEQYFFSSIESAINGLIELKLKRFDCKTIAELLTAIRTFRTELNDLLLPLNLRVEANKAKEVFV